MFLNEENASLDQVAAPGARRHTWKPLSIVLCSRCTAQGSRLLATKFKIINPKLETNSKSKIRMTKRNTDLYFHGFCFEFWSFELRACFGFRASDLGFSTSSQFTEKLRPQRIFLTKPLESGENNARRRVDATC
jgi:hypothetical protein